MRKIFISCLITALVIPVFSFNLIDFPAPRQSDSGPILKLEVYFGRKKMKCLGFGICRIKTDLDWGETPLNPPSDEPRAAYGEGWIQNGHLYIKTNARMMNPETYNELFASGVFKVEEDFALPEDAVNQFGVNGFTIKTGEYTVTKNTRDNSMVIEF